MFEKEAEEFERRKHYRYEDNDYCGDIADGIIQAYQQGAEFGYNKANEWHKQDTDDIYDFIAEDWSVKYFICIMKDKSRVTAMWLCDEGCNGEVRGNLFFDHDDEINDEKYYVDDIVRWKEITLPKETKEDD